MTIMIRPFQPDDLAAMVELTNRAAQADTGQPGQATAERLERYLNLSRTGTECLVAVLPDKAIAGYCSLRLEPESGELSGSGQIDPAHRRQGVGSRLLDAAESRGLELAQTAQHVMSLRNARDHETASIALLTAAGYQHLRSQAYMEMALTALQPVSPLPDGVILRPFDPQRDARAVYDAHQESFRPTQVHGDTPYAEWEQVLLKHPHFDPTLWLIAVDGDEIAGIVLNYFVGSGKMSNLAVLGVRQRWQRRGLGRGLLLRSLHLLQERGFERVGLLVDAGNRPNASHFMNLSGCKQAGGGSCTVKPYVETFLFTLYHTLYLNLLP
jgi:mycothiol synthase